MRLRVIGIDCATKASKAGVAAAWWDGEGLDVTHAFVGTTNKSMAEEFPGRIKEIVGDDQLAVFAIDAPLGWPAPLSDGLREHAAGNRLGGGQQEARFFRRLTDVRVKDVTKKNPLEVGANFIARTAFAALELLAALRRELDHEINLLWVPGLATTSGAIEVYPAVTLRAHGASIDGYKSDARDDWQPARSAIVDVLARNLSGIPGHRSAMIDCDHVLDAVACVLAAGDFLRDDVASPTEEELATAKREGWIWFKPPIASAMMS